MVRALTSLRRWLIAGICIGVLASAARGGAGEPKTAEARKPRIFEVVVALEKEKTEVQWERLFDLVAAIQKEVESKAGEDVPYKSRKAMVDIAAHRKLPLAKPGLHSLWSSKRHVSKVPPGPGGSYINTAVAVLPNSLSNQAPKNVEIVRDRNPARSEMWDGYISKSIVVVDGTILTTSYIYDSIVIAAGPIKIEGYINNSLVISVGSRGPSEVDLSQGYLANCVVVGERVAVSGYVHESLVFGKLRNDSLRGAVVRDHSDVCRIPWDVGAKDKEKPKQDK